MNRTILVTGASSDIGLALCRRYLAAGDRVIAHCRNGRPEFEQICATSDRIEPWRCDFSDTPALQEAIDQRPQPLASVDVLVHLAATLPRLSFEEASAEQIMSSLRVNALPAVLLMRAVGPGMSARGWGRIVVASSIGVKFGGGTDSFSYSLSKHLLEFVPKACRDWAAHGVLSNVIRVGVTATRIHSDLDEDRFAERLAKIPMRRAASADEMARTLHWFGSEQNSYITGQVIAVSGGE